MIWLTLRDKPGRRHLGELPGTNGLVVTACKRRLPLDTPVSGPSLAHQTEAVIQALYCVNCRRAEG